MLVPLWLCVVEGVCVTLEDMEPLGVAVTDAVTEAVKLCVAVPDDVGLLLVEGVVDPEAVPDCDWDGVLLTLAVPDVDCVEEGVVLMLGVIVDEGLSVFVCECVAEFDDVAVTEGVAVCELVVVAVGDCVSVGEYVCEGVALQLGVPDAVEVNDRVWL